MTEKMTPERARQIAQWADECAESYPDINELVRGYFRFLVPFLRDWADEQESTASATRPDACPHCGLGDIWWNDAAPRYCAGCEQAWGSPPAEATLKPGLTPHRCPVCEGRGAVQGGFYGDQALLTQKCRACDGKMILWA